MIPLILLALGLGAALTVYELSPRTRSRVDAYVRAIRSANVAHQKADAHLGTANAVAVTAVRHAQQANAARQAATWQTPWSPGPAPAPAPWMPPWVPMPTPMQPAPMQPAPMQQQPPMQPTVEQPMPMQPTVEQPMPMQPTVEQPMPMQPMPEPSPAPLPPPPYAQPPVPVQDIADAQANAADVATDVAVDHAAQAIEANQEAAQSTADAAQNAQTEAERQLAAQSAAKVLEREKKIAAALASLGIGQCGVRSYPRVTERTKNALLAKLRSEGMAVSGDNPWNINTNQYGVKLRAVWDPNAQLVKLIVTAGKGGYFGAVTCAEIWKKIDPIMKEVIG